MTLSLQRLLGECRNEIGRVLESQVSSQDALTSLSQLDTIRFQSTTALKLRYKLHAFNRNQTSEPEAVPALFQPEERRLLFCQREGQHPWAAIARELAVALFPDEDPGRFAAGLKEVLASKSVAEAAATLDELGFARLDTTVGNALSSEETVAHLGEEGTSFEDSSVCFDGTVDFSARDETSPEEAIDNILGAGAPPPSPPISEAMKGETGAGAPTSGRTGHGNGPTSKKGRPVLEEYVPSPDGDKAEIDDAGDDELGRSPIDEAGVRRVMEYEASAERVPTEMPHKNPGYDVESRNGSGDIVRYIEVKSFSGNWSDTYADLSKTQFHKGNDLGELFWLYVVERAEQEDYVIHRIQNPARQANHFMFDDGWSVLAERTPDVAKKTDQWQKLISQKQSLFGPASITRTAHSKKFLE